MRFVTPPLSLYVHLPWCVRKCPYCDFNSYALKGELEEQRYLAALTADLAAQAQAGRGREVVSIFFGGGTPSLFTPQGIGTLLQRARQLLTVAADAEITLEANPGTIERGRFAEYRDAGVNRVSLGAQSFDAMSLAALGRIHSADDTRRAAAELHSAGLSNFNLDLMYALPGQTAAGAVQDIEAALALHPSHLSHYQLTLEPGTPFAAQPPALPDDDAAAAMLSACGERLQHAGLAQYEVSAYRRAGRECRHNLNYWEFGDYLGIGAGAHGKLTDAASGRVVRTRQPRDPRRYMRAAGSSCTTTTIPAAELPFEFMLNSLRLRDGFRIRRFEERTGLEWGSVRTQVDALMARGLLQLEDGRCAASPRGSRFLNDLLLEFLPERPKTAGVTRLSTSQ